MVRGLVHHIDLTVSDLAASRRFYDAVLGFLGYRRTVDYDDGTDWDLVQSDPAVPFHSIGVVAARGPGRDRVHDRYSPGLHHLAWASDSREDVERMHAMLLSIGATILDPPADYPQYSPDYHAVFFADPDGLKLEYVWSPAGWGDD